MPMQVQVSKVRSGDGPIEICGEVKRGDSLSRERAIVSGKRVGRNAGAETTVC